jgi:hypothetical protein
MMSMICDSCKRADKQEDDWPCKYCHPDTRDTYYELKLQAKKYPMACCEKAKPINCVCAYSYDCPVHGAVHIGTHD